MAVNTAHSNNGIILQYGEYMLLHFNQINLEISGNDPIYNHIFSGPKKGRIFLTSQRIIFRNKKRKTLLQSFSVPFMAMFNLSLGQPIFRPNYIKGSVFAMPDGNFSGIVTFKFSFNNGGAILYGQVMMRAASRILQSTINERLIRCGRHDNPSQPPPPPPYHAQLSTNSQPEAQAQHPQENAPSSNQHQQQQQDKPPSYEDSVTDSLPSYEDSVA